MTAASTSGDLISLPKGGGVLRGLGETFKPDLHTGTGNFAVPIALPVGRAGLAPNLELHFSTGAGNGPFGLGWNMDVPGVARRTARGVPRYDGEDFFVLSGAEDLVELGTDLQPGVTQFRPRTEGLFARITRHAQQGNDYWEVATKDGSISVYGSPSVKPPVQTGEDPRAVITDPGDRANVFAWRLTETRDPPPPPATGSSTITPRQGSQPRQRAALSHTNLR
jgi:hypothetical protein